MITDDCSGIHEHCCNVAQLLCRYCPQLFIALHSLLPSIFEQLRRPGTDSLLQLLLA